MKLVSAVVPSAKITGYLLSATHRDGRHKAAFFTRFGFTAEDWETLAAALLRHAAEHEVAKIVVAQKVGGEPRKRFCETLYLQYFAFWG